MMACYLSTVVDNHSSLSTSSDFKANYQAARDNSNLWRNYNDVSTYYWSIASIILFYERNQDVLIQVNGPGGWNDPDMVGFIFVLYTVFILIKAHA
jgi:hypothetical protein